MTEPKERIILRDPDGTIEVTEPDGIQRIYNAEHHGNAWHIHPDGSRLWVVSQADRKMRFVYYPSPRENLPYERAGIHIYPDSGELRDICANLKPNRADEERLLYSYSDLRQRISPEGKKNRLEIHLQENTRENPPEGLAPGCKGFDVPARWKPGMTLRVDGKTVSPSEEMLAIIQSPPLKTVLDNVKKFGFKVTCKTGRNKTRKVCSIEARPPNDKLFLQQSRTVGDALKSQGSYADGLRRAAENVSAAWGAVAAARLQIDTLSKREPTEKLLTDHAVDMVERRRAIEAARKKLVAVMDQLDEKMENLKAAVADMQVPDLPSPDAPLAERSFSNRPRNRPRDEREGGDEKGRGGRG